MSKSRQASASTSSMAALITLCDGGLLPVQEPAFRYSMMLTKSMLGGEIGMSNITIRQYFENLGISFTTPHATIKGWHYCNLPNGWTYRHDCGSGIDECIAYFNANHQHVFTLILRKKPGDTKCLLASIDLSRP